MLGYVARVAPLAISIEDVGNAATFLCSGTAAGVTGEILYVDSGFSTVGMSSRRGRTGSAAGSMASIRVGLNRLAALVVVGLAASSRCSTSVSVP
jgi:hypothetical protein